MDNKSVQTFQTIFYSTHRIKFMTYIFFKNWFSPTDFSIFSLLTFKEAKVLPKLFFLPTLISQFSLKS